MKLTALNWLMAFVFSFGSQEGGFEGWRTVDDRVMGGVSFSKVMVNQSSMLWEGTMSLESNGGFASVRSPWKIGQIGGAASVTMRVRGSKGVFSLRLATSQAYYEPIYQVGFEVDEQEWTTLTWPLEVFETTVMGRPEGSLMKANEVNNVGRVGFMKNDGNPGEFWLEVDFIRFE